MFGKDFFKIFNFVVQILKLMTDIFGTKEDKDGWNNHASESVKLIENAAGKPKP